MISKYGQMVLSACYEISKGASVQQKYDEKIIQSLSMHQSIPCSQEHLSILLCFINFPENRIIEELKAVNFILVVC